MIRFIKYIAFLVVGVFFLANLISASSLFMLRQGAFYKPAFLVNTVKSKTFDYIVLGASTGLTTLNTKIIDSISDLKGLNLAIDDTGISNHYLMLQHFLAEGNKTEYCILVPGLAGVDNLRNSIGDNDYRFLMYVNRPYVSNYFKTLNPKSNLNVLYHSKWLPFLGVSYYNAELFFPSLVSALNPEKRNRFDNRGNYTYPIQHSKLQSRHKTMQHLGFNNPYLNKIEDLCRENQIKLIYYFPPNRIKTLTFETITENVINHSNSLESDLYFYDDIHVNKLGNKEVSQLFVKDFIKKQNSFSAK